MSVKALLMAGAILSPLPAHYVAAPPAPPPVTWEGQMLTGLEAPLSPTSIQALDVWAQSEGVLGSNNPLASSGFHLGSVGCIAQCGSSSPIYSYDSMSDGVSANVAFLYGSNYDGVRAAFRANAGLQAIWSAINQSKWCKGCQGGLYPIDLYRAAQTPPPPAAPAQTVSINSPLP